VEGFVHRCKAPSPNLFLPLKTPNPLRLFRPPRGHCLMGGGRHIGLPNAAAPIEEAKMGPGSSVTFSTVEKRPHQLRWTLGS